MNSSIIIISVLSILLVSLLMLRLRLRCQIGEGQRLLFIGLGRSGVELDWSEKTGRILLFGLRLRQFELDKKRVVKKVSDKKPKPEKIKKIKRTKKTKRIRPIQDILLVLKSSFGPIWRWIISVLRATRFEELNGDIKGGFEAIDLTGQAYGYYHALVGAVPALSGRVKYYPDWEGVSFEANFRASLVVPLYSLVGRTIVLVLRLPLRKIINLAIGRKKVGNPNGQ